MSSIPCNWEGTSLKIYFFKISVWYLLDLVSNNQTLTWICVFSSEAAEAIDQAIAYQMQKVGVGVWQCVSCGWETKYKTRLYEHVEAKHVGTNGHTCTLCGKFSASLKALKMHKLKYHRKNTREDNQYEDVQGYWNKLFESFRRVNEID